MLGAIISIPLLRGGGSCGAPAGLPAGGGPHRAPASPKKASLHSNGWILFFFFSPQISQYKEIVYLERSRDQKHRQIALLLLRQQSTPGPAGTLAQRAGRGLPPRTRFPSDPNRLSEGHRLFRTTTGLFPGWRFLLIHPTSQRARGLGCRYHRDTLTRWPERRSKSCHGHHFFGLVWFFFPPASIFPSNAQALR